MPTQKEWEKEFDDRFTIINVTGFFGVIGGAGSGLNLSANTIKSFIADLLQQSKEETMIKVTKFIEENRYKIERIDRYVFDDLLELLNQSK